MSSIGVPVGASQRASRRSRAVVRKRTGRLILGIPGAVSRAVGGVSRIRRVPRISRIGRISGASRVGGAAGVGISGAGCHSRLHPVLPVVTGISRHSRISRRHRGPHIIGSSRVNGRYGAGRASRVGVSRHGRISWHRGRSRHGRISRHRRGSRNAGISRSRITGGDVSGSGSSGRRGVNASGRSSVDHGGFI